MGQIYGSTGIMNVILVDSFGPNGTQTFPDIFRTISNRRRHLHSSFCCTTASGCGCSCCGEWTWNGNGMMGMDVIFIVMLTINGHLSFGVDFLLLVVEKCCDFTAILGLDLDRAFFKVLPVSALGSLEARNLTV